ncbi:MAG: DNA repair protein RecO [Polymorphobacter sp.]|uniref:DNA repair protein RecO n=1 Tax=Polymorphobacter sp. TaxID=1909290 RepID=UPI003A85D9F7
MDLTTPALACTVLTHGETGAILRALTPAHGLVAGYINGGRSRRLRPLLQPGNILQLHLHGRLDSQLARATAELIEPRAALITSGFAFAVLEWSTALTAAALPEAAPHPMLYAALDALTALLAADADAARIAATLARYELLLLAELGFAPDLSSCAATGATTDLAYVSPKSSQAVSRAAGLPYAARLLPLPAFLIAEAPAQLADARDALTLTRHFLARDILTGAAARLFAARDRLVTRLTAMDEPGPPG